MKSYFYFKDNINRDKYNPKSKNLEFHEVQKWTVQYTVEFSLPCVTSVYGKHPTSYLSLNQRRTLVTVKEREKRGNILYSR